MSNLMSNYISRKFFIAVFFTFLFSPFYCLAADILPTLEGIIEAKEVIELGSQTPGIVEKILVERGDRVTKGQLLIQLRADVEKADVELKEAKVEFLKRKVDRSRELSREEMISVNEMDEIQTELLLARLELNESRALLQLKSITSPIKGIVTSRDCSAGEYIGSDLAILSLAQIDPLYVEVVAPISCFGSIHKDMKAKIRPEEPLHGLSYTATVIIVDQVIDAASGTFGVRLLLPNPKMTLPAGLKCQVQFF